MLTFFFTMMLIYWRPKGIHEAIPAAVGAAIILVSGAVSLSSLVDIGVKVSGAAVTIISTFIMALVLESIGFFHWIAAMLAERANGSGVRLFWYTNALCFLMTLFFNNDGSIIITTPILLLLLKSFQLKRHEQLPYLISGALIATASSAPIGVSNMVNLISLKIIDMSLYLQTAMMFVPSMLGLLFLVGMLFAVFYNDLPRTLPPLSIPITPRSFYQHPLSNSDGYDSLKISEQKMKAILLFVLVMRASLFVASYLHIPVEWVALAGAGLLLGWRWYALQMKPFDVLQKAPWHILVFAFGMYIIVYGLNGAGLGYYLVQQLQPYVSNSFHAIFIMGSLMSVLSNVFNNHPALMIGTLTLTEMHIDPIVLKAAYLAMIIGSDIGSLLLPTGTLATLLWLHILKKYRYPLLWSTYTKISLLVIPPTVLVTLTILYGWIFFLSSIHLL
ncbi:arsenic transporter [Geobacillus sp. 46C-IIa]|uniref:arsenic transporter n=2 Tax=Geobacillus sp. 46C-IIa TaxID=1963025 RepID=UPI0009BDDFB3|nr:arsenic transporter [Geobacillus sp. 46C-IIa]OQP07167.1 arsenic transporter [Geobacillus sp. 46C-IIa]QNU29489.1 arsenic transporter [Geobacillus sp. 46C-IIa]